MLALSALAAAGTETPAVFLIGDSTVRNGTSGQAGWGDCLSARFDPAITVINRAIGGRSSRSFLTEGRWDEVRDRLRKGDHVLIQFGHNDGGPSDDPRDRASIKGIGGETREVVRNGDGKPETVRSYGWYLTRYVRDARERGAVPVVLSPVPRNIWKDGAIQRDVNGYNKWAREIAEREQALFVPLHDLVADAYERIGREETALLFTEGDHTHTNAGGAAFTARIVAAALRSLDGCALAAHVISDDTHNSETQTKPNLQPDNP